MRSAGAPAATVLTIMTLVFAPMFGYSNGNGQPQKLVNQTTSEVSVPCVGGAACPGNARFNEKVSAADSSPAAIQTATDGAIAQAIADFKAGQYGR